MIDSRLTRAAEALHMRAPKGVARASKESLLAGRSEEENAARFAGAS